MFDETKKATSLFDAIEANFGIKWSEVEWEDLQKPLYSGLAARIAIDKLKTNIPRSTEDQATIWAEHHQTIDSNVELMKKRFTDFAGSLVSSENPIKLYVSKCRYDEISFCV